MARALWNANAKAPPKSFAMRARLTQSTITPESPNEPILTKWRTTLSPERLTQEIRPTSIGRTGALRKPRDGRDMARIAIEGFAEIAARAAGDEAEHGVGRDGPFLIEEAVDGFVDRAVAADGDDFGMAFAQRFAHEFASRRRACASWRFRAPDRPRARRPR